MSAKVSQIVFRFTASYQILNQKTHISASFVHKCHKSCSYDLTVLLFDEQKWQKTHISASLCAQVSQIVFLADLTVLHLITTVWTKIVTKLISPRVLCTSVTNRVLTWFDRFMAKYNSMIENVAKIISPRVVCTNITNRVLSWFDRFTAFYYCMSKKLKKNSYLHEFCAQLSQIVFLADLTVLLLIRTVWRKKSENSYLRGFCAQVSQIVFLADLTVFTDYYYCMRKKIHKTHISTSFVHKYHKSCS